MSWTKTIVLAVIQGLTEFLPVSSDGHLAVANALFNRLAPSYGTIADDFFYVVALHVGTLTAILIYYRRFVARGAAGLLRDAPDSPPDLNRAAVVRAGLLAFVAMLPALPVALYLKPSIEQLFGSTRVAALGFLVTAVELLLVARLPEGRKTLRQTTWLDALLIGVGQVFAVLPGVSRSGTTIAVALALGLTRPWAVGFSLLIAVPAIVGGALLELRDVDLGILGWERWGQVIVGTVVAGVIGYGAIAWLSRVVARGRLWYFSVYLVVLALVVLVGFGGASGPRETGAGDGSDSTTSARP